MMLKKAWLILILLMASCSAPSTASVFVVNYDAASGKIRSYTLLNGSGESNETARTVAIGGGEKQIIWPLSKYKPLTEMQAELDKEIKDSRK